MSKVFVFSGVLGLKSVFISVLRSLTLKLISVLEGKVEQDVRVVGLNSQLSTRVYLLLDRLSFGIGVTREGALIVNLLGRGNVSRPKGRFIDVREVV